MVDITGAREAGDEVVLELTDRRTGTVTELHRDMVFLGTGFDTRMPRLVRELAGSLELDRVDVSRELPAADRYRRDRRQHAACYLQGVNEETHGISDSLLSVLAQRAEEICRDIIAHRERIPAVAVSAEEPAGL